MGLCHTLRHDGIDYGDYIEQITYLLFLKMADERGIDLSALPYEKQDHKGRRRKRKKDCSWPALRIQSGVDLTDHYAEFLRILGKQPGTSATSTQGAVVIHDAGRCSRCRGAHSPGAGVPGRGVDERRGGP